MWIRWHTLMASGVLTACTLICIVVLFAERVSDSVYQSHSDPHPTPAGLLVTDCFSREASADDQPWPSFPSALFSCSEKC